MKVHTDLDRLPAFNRAVITIGTFDGVHRGHQQILDTLKREAAAIGGETVIITFHPHPRKVVSSTILGVRLINTLEEKIGLLAQMGIDHLVVVPFTDAFANQAAEDYVASFLVSRFKPASIIIGYDHRFGRDCQPIPGKSQNETHRHHELEEMNMPADDKRQHPDLRS